MRNFLFRYPLVKKILFSLWISIVFLMGRYIPLPHVDMSQVSLVADSSLEVASALSGGSLANIGLFSLGLGPWMYSTVLNRVCTLGRKRQVGGNTQQRKQLLVMLLVAMIQGLGIALTLTYVEHSIFNSIQLIAMTTLLLVAGSFVLTWLGNLNVTYGVGGSTLIMFLGMIVSQFRAVPIFVDVLAGPKAMYALFILVWTLLSIYVTVVFEKAEYRIPIERVSINSEMVKKAYLPIRVNPSNGMPIMYAYTFLALPQYFLMVLSYLLKDTSLLQYGVYFTTRNEIGIGIYLLLVLLLSYSFAFVNLDPLSISKEFRASGDYIKNVRSGKPTQLYLTDYIRFFGIFSGIIMGILLSTPLILFLSEQELQTITPLSGIFMMMTGMVLMIREEVFTSRLRRQYTELF
ncbi:accessory Sec system protein translocase subunit SecY2 [Streptococcus sp. zg-86]|uniref:Accessory Sec system protein translocase subunit SecY2 n=1 Tax=Streptococcus zhangguiae TaxID=2664091 RepID=A0A6I4RHI1_9STRE|nr:MULTISPECIES: accessory Sec system protein translocase subunit SecY2 [unclassified Streptococcus]MTB64877.1 accessory Sec system protein translocase subunit SecY2 [Streptococcus sp. zg-86]MTB91053.1 accessory Sec system protein translocase subunit SecY2 [Streptococcus sp. zg-36]MWV56864.1 accessory Sec system protein translocase subunit SecY2 [Streptococcus sp. zg-70]QTH48332.1 accessory Sec system protein translocase subunit SecY2 [Streptococcus sp. zg-86]